MQYLNNQARALPAALQMWGTVEASDGATVTIRGLSGLARLGDQVEIAPGPGQSITAEVVALGEEDVRGLLMGSGTGIGAGMTARLTADPGPRPGVGWLGQVVDGAGLRADGTPPPLGPAPGLALRAVPPRSDRRRPLGPRLQTGLVAFDTLLPICRGQRLGIFAGSGVGKSSLLTRLAEGVAADVVVIGLIGERGREVGDFIRRLRESGALSRTVVVAATSDQSALMKRRAALLTMTVAEHFRDKGQHVLCLLDSVTRFAEAHREIALAAGEPPALRAYPPSTGGEIAALCERAGPGSVDDKGGDITGIFTVLVAGSDTEEPVSDMLRGTLDGHVVLDRAIAERGRYPAIDLRRSVSRSAELAWNPEEAALCARARRLIATYEEAAPMIQAGLYTPGGDTALDEAVAFYPALDALAGAPSPGDGSVAESYAALERAMERAG
ncbi:MAG: flagellum-specific ATP synthase FliI [Pseudomonadota bacterium]